MKYREFEELTKQDQPVLIDFYSDWCAPCKVLEPIIEDVASFYGNMITVLKVNTDKNPEITGRLNIFSIPTLMIFKNGKQEWRVTGVRSAKEIKKQINKALGINEEEHKRDSGFLKSILKSITE